MGQNKMETNTRVNKIKRRLHICKATGKCTICPMHGGENTSRRPKHGAQKPKSKK